MAVEGIGSGILTFTERDGSIARFRCSRHAPLVIHVLVVAWGWLVRYRGSAEDLILAGIVHEGWLEGLGARKRKRTVYDEYGDTIVVEFSSKAWTIDHHIHHVAPDWIGTKAWRDVEEMLAAEVGAALKRAQVRAVPSHDQGE